MKQCVCVMFLALCCWLAGSNSCGAEEASAPQDVWFEHIAGNWYDGDGKQVLDIEGGCINGQAVQSVRSFSGGNPGSGIFCLEDGTEIYLAWIGDGLHRLLRANEGDELLPSGQPAYFESVDGVFLGMRKAELLAHWGEPDQRPALQFWRYEGKGVDVFFTGDVVTGIRLNNTSTLQFSRSGLKGTDSLEHYAKFYGWKQLPALPIGPYMNVKGNSIGQGEYLFFDAYPVSVLLSVFPNFS